MDTAIDFYTNVFDMKLLRRKHSGICRLWWWKRNTVPEPGLRSWALKNEV